MQQPKVKQNIKKELREWAVSLGLALAAFLVIHTFVFTMISVDGTSMAETLHDSDRLAATIIDMKINGPQRQDVVICTYPGADHYCVKRVIAMPGETIQIAGGVTYIDGEPLDEPYVTDAARQDFGPLTVPENCYFVMGDNRNNSLDSRAPSVGPLPRDAFYAKAHVRLWPIDQFRIFQ